MITAGIILFHKIFELIKKNDDDQNNINSGL